MARIVVKATKDRDLYCMWSSYTDSPTLIGTRAHMATELLGDYAPNKIRDYGQTYVDDEIEQILARTDEHGSSDRGHGAGHWGQTLSYRGQGLLVRDRLADLLDRSGAETLEVEALIAEGIVEPWGDD